MAEELDNSRPIIIKRVKKSSAGHHGGSWKVAFADFATAMMAFFLLLWLMGNTTEEEKDAISGYFNDPSGFAEKAGAAPTVIGEGGANTGVIEMPVVRPELEVNEENADSQPRSMTEEEIRKKAEDQEIAQLKQLQQQLEEMVENNDAFRQFKEQVIFDITPSGLRIQIVDKDKRPMFDSGSAEPKIYSKLILRGLGEVLKAVPNKVSITGHTDATPYIEREDYGNWELSADRANSARRELMVGGISEAKVARVEGFASSILFDAESPYNPINRRIAIIVLKNSAAEDIEKQVLGIN
ncbi:flagellar motor protein MotB [Aliikangiella marina]|uniref:Flagellar motor protein MotB n=1 Tax=Aliikangiella marina TaxID=1712262 RepID=A0A545T788_9GAMM|nr:flagellar motor protein MotB [Aliikangiella marina]TQV73035.1 flagellar motor protein MotB [Aliikangiella marina]